MRSIHKICSALTNKCYLHFEWTMLFIFELYANSLVFATELVFGIEFEREINDREKQTTTTTTNWRN